MLNRLRVAGLGACVAVLCGAVAPAWGVANGSPVKEGEFGFVVRVQVDETRSCTGVVVTPQWVLTSMRCLAVNVVGNVPDPLPSGLRVIVRGPGAQGMPQQMNVTRAVSHADRSVVLLRLAGELSDVPVASFRSDVPLVGAGVRVAGYGRSDQDLQDDVLQVGTFRVTEIKAKALTIVGVLPDRPGVCVSDIGAPLVRQVGGYPRVVGIVEAAGSPRCVEDAGVLPGTTAVRTDGLETWIAQVVGDTTYSDKADEIFEEYGIRLFDGDGGIRFTGSTSLGEGRCPSDEIQVEQQRLENPYIRFFCFKALAEPAVLRLQIPGVISLRNGDTLLRATVTEPGGQRVYNVAVGDRISTDTGEGLGLSEAVLVELRVPPLE